MVCHASVMGFGMASNHYKIMFSSICHVCHEISKANFLLFYLLFMIYSGYDSNRDSNGDGVRCFLLLF